jgi:hypothetical protein
LGSCDLSGNVFLTNGYEESIVVITQYNYNESILERRNVFYKDSGYCVDARHPQYRNLISIRIETIDGIRIAEYNLEYLVQLRKAYGKKRTQQEAWIFTEKGLFLETIHIDRRFNFNSEKIMEYYRSNEAVDEQERLLSEA